MTIFKKIGVPEELQNRGLLQIKSNIKRYKDLKKSARQGNLDKGKFFDKIYIFEIGSNVLFNFWAFENLQVLGVLFLPMFIANFFE